MTANKEHSPLSGGYSPFLTIQKDGRIREVFLEKADIVLGRAGDCGIILEDDNAVSPHHARLLLENGTWFLADAGSTGGCFLNALPVTKKKPLKHLDTIQLGSTMLIFNDPETVPQKKSDPHADPGVFDFDSLQQVIRRLEENISQVFKGKKEVIRHLIVCLLADGHLLVEDAPGVGKSLLAQTLAKSVQARYKRIQFTPDMLPSDVTGMNIYDEMQKDFRFLPGPIFGNVILADEINRTTPRTQSSLLECMSEAAVTVDGKCHLLPKPFFVIATQNPGDYQGTYPLPEPQLDRFLMCLNIGYPSFQAEKEILDTQISGEVLSRISYVISSSDVIRCQALVREITVSDAIKNYIISIADATRSHQALVNGTSPRATLALMRASQSFAACSGRNYVTPQDVKQMLKPVFAHRLTLKLRARAEWKSVEYVLDKIIESVKLKNEDRL